MTRAMVLCFVIPNRIIRYLNGSLLLVLRIEGHICIFMDTDNSVVKTWG